MGRCLMERATTVRASCTGVTTRRAAIHLTCSSAPSERTSRIVTRRGVRRGIRSADWPRRLPVSDTPEGAILKEAGELAKRQLLDIATAMYGVTMGADGETFGDRAMSRSDRILRWVTAAQDGTLDILQAQSPRIYARDLA